MGWIGNVVFVGAVGPATELGTASRAEHASMVAAVTATDIPPLCLADIITIGPSVRRIDSPA